MVERRCCLGRRLGRSALRGREARRRRRPLRRLERDCRLGLVDSRSPLDLGRGGDLAGFHGWVWGVGLGLGGSGEWLTGTGQVQGRPSSSVGLAIRPCRRPARWCGHSWLARTQTRRGAHGRGHAPVFESGSVACARRQGRPSVFALGWPPSPPRLPGLETAAGAGGLQLAGGGFAAAAAAAAGRRGRLQTTPLLRPARGLGHRRRWEPVAGACDGSACGAWVVELGRRTHNPEPYRHPTIKHSFSNCGAAPAPPGPAAARRWNWRWPGGF